ncbi:MAG TPA: Uma2 family endonuclease [Chthonomonadaceae bacterium]|nr:Uma2 family endonuclease [Chthonomonadaceae bacterium]
MAVFARQRYTPEEYLALERSADTKSEYFEGEIRAMAGGTPQHGAITVNISSELRMQLKGKPCQVFSSDVKVRTRPDGLFTYPDVSVVCGALQFHDEREDVLTNPCVIVEVLSDSTEAEDRGRKFFQYRQIETLTDYLLVSQKEPLIDYYEKQEDGRWLLASVVGLESSLTLDSVGCVLALSEVYDKIQFPVEEAQAPGR